jgi:hypothetical protein
LVFFVATGCNRKTITTKTISEIQTVKNLDPEIKEAIPLNKPTKIETSFNTISFEPIVSEHSTTIKTKGNKKRIVPRGTILLDSARITVKPKDFPIKSTIVEKQKIVENEKKESRFFDKLILGIILLTFIFFAKTKQT